MAYNFPDQFIKHTVYDPQNTSSNNNFTEGKKSQRSGERDILMNQQELIKNFTRHHYNVHYFEEKMDAVSYLCSTIKGTTVGFGDSQTLTSLHLFPKLSVENTVYDPQNTVSSNDFLETAQKCLTTDIYITSVNAFSFTGELVNIDGTGNRIAASLFGHTKVYFVIGSNKGEATLEKAI